MARQITPFPAISPGVVNSDYWSNQRKNMLYRANNDRPKRRSDEPEEFKITVPTCGLRKRNTIRANLARSVNHPVEPHGASN